MTRNQDLNVLHVDNASQWAAPSDARVVSGDTLIFDFVYFLHPVSSPHMQSIFLSLARLLASCWLVCLLACLVG